MLLTPLESPNCLSGNDMTPKSNQRRPLEPRMLEENMNSAKGVKDRDAGSKDEAMSVFDLLFGCSHKRCSFPMTVRGKLRRIAAASVTGTYVACLDCGQEFPYDWNKMKSVKVGTKSQTASSDTVTVLSDPEAA